jgi:hypothetical protein
MSWEETKDLESSSAQEQSIGNDAGYMFGETESLLDPRGNSPIRVHALSASLSSSLGRIEKQSIKEKFWKNQQ